MLDHETIQCFSEWIANNLQAHSDELQDEMLFIPVSYSESGQSLLSAQNGMAPGFFYEVTP